MDNKEILDQFLNGVVKELKAAIPKNFGDTLEVETDETSGRIWASPFISVLEFGRGPTKPGAKKGNPTLLEQIKSWIKSRGLILNPYAVTRNIHKYGTVTWRVKGRTGMLSSVLNNVRTQSLIGAFGDKYQASVSSSII